MFYVLIGVGLWLIYLDVQSLLTKKTNIARATAARQWPSVTGRIVDCTVDVGRNRSSETGQTYHTYKPQIEYSYTVGGTSYKSTQFAFQAPVLYYQQSEIDAFMKTYEKGAEVPVYYDPAKPAESVLDTSPPKIAAGDFAMMGFGFAVALLGILGMLKIIA